MGFHYLGPYPVVFNCTTLHTVPAVQYNNFKHPIWNHFDNPVWTARGRIQDLERSREPDCVKVCAVAEEEEEASRGLGDKRVQRDALAGGTCKIDWTQQPNNIRSCFTHKPFSFQVCVRAAAWLTQLLFAKWSSRIPGPCWHVMTNVWTLTA